jgi:hypothetical protein
MGKDQWSKIVAVLLREVQALVLGEGRVVPDESSGSGARDSEPGSRKSPRIGRRIAERIRG